MVGLIINYMKKMTVSNSMVFRKVNRGYISKLMLLCVFVYAYKGMCI